MLLLLHVAVVRDCVTIRAIVNTSFARKYQRHINIMSWYIVSDGNKTKMLRQRPRPVKQQQDNITEKNYSVATRMFVIKKLLCAKNVTKWYDDQFTFGTVSALIARKIQVFITWFGDVLVPGDSVWNSRQTSLPPKSSMMELSICEDCVIL